MIWVHQSLAQRNICNENKNQCSKSANFVVIEPFISAHLKTPLNNNFNKTIAFLGQRLKESLDHLTLIYTTDTHRNLDRMPNLKSAIDKFRHESENSLAIHAGDYGMGTRGLDLQVEFLNKLGFDFATLGNHEFIVGLKNLARSLEKTNFQTILSNLNVPETNPLSKLLKNGKIADSTIKTINGHKYGFVGATTEEINKFKKYLDGAYIVDTEKVISQKVRELEKQGVDRIILISHLGYNKDLEIAKIPGIDVIVGGHKHYAIQGIKKNVNLFETERKEPVLILHGGAHNHYIGISNLVFNNNGILQIQNAGQNKFDRIKTALKSFFNNLYFYLPVKQTAIYTSNNIFDLNQFKPDPAMKTFVNQEFSRMTKIGDIKKPVNKAWPQWQSCPTGSLIADAVKKMTNSHPDKDTHQTQIALINPDSYKRGIERGALYAEYIKDFVIPFSTPIVKVKLSGKNLLEALNNSANCVNNKTSPGILQVSGLKYTIDLKRPESKRVPANLVLVNENGKYVPLDLNKNYIVAYDKFLHAGNECFTPLKHGELLEIFDKSSSAEALINYIINSGGSALHSADHKKRIRILNNPREPLSLNKILGWFGISNKDIIVCGF